MLFSRVLSAAVAVGRVLAAPTEDNALLARQDDNVALSIDTNSSPVKALEKLQAAAEEKINRLETERSSGHCSPSNTRIRKDCGPFLTWHRAFVWFYETALRDECGYKGAQPYWNWFADTEDLTKSPVFDGSDTSMGGDGEYVKHNGSLGGARHIYLPSGAGGGCIQSGPFKNAQASIGPFNPAMDGMGPIVETLADYNPRCVQRDLNTFAMKTWYTTENLLNVTIGDASKTHRSFWSEIQGRYPDQFLGLHTTGHYSINGDNTDLYSSPNDPAFFLHHAMFDRLYWIHQVLHPREARKVAGTMTLQNKPPSRDATVDDVLEMGAVGDTHPIKNMFDTLGGTPLCYIYL